MSLRQVWNLFWWNEQCWFSDWILGGSFLPSSWLKFVEAEPFSSSTILVNSICTLKRRSMLFALSAEIKVFFFKLWNPTISLQNLNSNPFSKPFPKCAGCCSGWTSTLLTSHWTKFSVRHHRPSRCGLTSAHSLRR